MKSQRTYITALVKLDAPCSSSNSPPPLVSHVPSIHNVSDTASGQLVRIQVLGHDIGAGHWDSHSARALRFSASLCLSFSVSKDVRHSRTPSHSTPKVRQLSSSERSAARLYYREICLSSPNLLSLRDKVAVFLTV